MSGAVPADDVAHLQRLLAALDVLKTNYHGDYAGLRDISQAAVNAQLAINRLLGRPPLSGANL